MALSTFAFPFLLGDADTKSGGAASICDHDVASMGYKPCPSERRHQEDAKVPHGHPATMTLDYSWLFLI